MAKKKGPPPPPTPLQIVEKSPKTSTPRTYSEIIAARIFEGLSQGISLKVICQENGMPSQDRVLYWAQFPDEEARPEFAQRYLEARKIGWLLLGESILDIADDDSSDMVTRKVRDRQGNIQEVVVDNPLNLQRAKLKIDTRKWLLSKVLPEVYGDKLEVTHAITDDLLNRINAAQERVKKLPIQVTPPTEQLVEEFEGIVQQLEDGSLNITSRFDADA